MSKKSSIEAPKFMSELWENLDEEDKKEFKTMKAAIDKAEKANVQGRWKKNLKEKVDAQKASCFRMFYLMSQRLNLV